MKIVSASGEWYQCDFVPDGNGTFEVISAFSRATLADTPEGIVFVPPGSPVFPANSVLINNWSTGKIVTAPLDANGDPIVANTQDVIAGFGASEGPAIDPVTGDLLFWSTNQGGVIFRVSGFEVPPTPGPTPTPTPGPCPFRVLIAHTDHTAADPAAKTRYWPNRALPRWTVRCQKRHTNPPTTTTVRHRIRLLR